MMTKTIFLSMTIFLSSVAGVLAQADSRWIADPGAGEVSFVLSSTLHDVRGTAGEYEVFLKFSPDGQDIEGQGVFKISSMKTGNGIRDRKMRQMFDAERYPEITYSFDQTVMPGEMNGDTELRGRLTISGVTHVHPIRVTVEKKDGRMTFSGETEISLNAFGLKPPGMMGMIKVKDIVSVKFQLVYVRQQDK